MEKRRPGVAPAANEAARDKPLMRICFASDLHGSRILYRQLGDLVRRERPDLLILGGDIFPDGQDHDPAATQAAYVSQQLVPQVREWEQAAPGLTVACLMGNHDWAQTEAAVRAAEHTGHLVLLDLRRPWSCGGVSFLGCPLTPPTPHWVKDYERLDLDRDPVPAFEGAIWATRADGSIAEVSAAEHFGGRPSLDTELAAASIPQSPWILVAHAPPFDSRLDRLPNLDQPIGSRGVRRFIEQHRPLCALHGHVHDSPAVTGSFADEIGGVLCINPGQAHERLHAVLFDSDRPRVTLRHTVLA